MTTARGPAPHDLRIPPAHAARQRPATRRVLWPLLAAGALLLLGVALRWPIVRYDGPADQWVFNEYILQFIGGYSDIAQLYFRDELWRHPLPYFDYAIEYQVGIAWLVWLVGFVPGGMATHFLVTAAIMVAAGLLVVLMVARFAGASVWLLALSPTLALYVALNWDMVGVLLMVAALLLFQRRREGWGALALAAAVWTKLFPIVLLPYVLIERLLGRRWRSGLTIVGVFGAASLLFNGPVALEPTATGLTLRENWLYFFRFNKHRPPEYSLWQPLEDAGLTVDQVNAGSALLLIVGLAVIAASLYLAWRRAGSRARDLALPAGLAAMAWLFFVNKVNNPQYSLWIAALLALAGAPVALTAVFACVEVGYFVAVFTMLSLNATQSPSLPWFTQHVLLPAIVVREATFFAIGLWALGQVRSAGAEQPAIRPSSPPEPRVVAARGRSARPLRLLSERQPEARAAAGQREGGP